MSKHSGNTRTKKQGRRVRAEQRRKELETMTPEQRQARFAENKALYDSSHKS